MTLLRRVLGETLRGQRLRQRRTLREVSGAARVSLGYLSEVERGQKEASSELLASICEALEVRMSDLLREVSDQMRRTERSAEVAGLPARALVPAGVGGPVRRPLIRPGERGGLGLDAFDPSGLDADGAEAAPAEAADAGHDKVSREVAALEVPAGGFDLELAGLDAPVGPDGAELDGAGLDMPVAPGRDQSRLERFGIDIAELDGVDLAELETGDGLGEVEALLGLTDLPCLPDSFGPAPRNARLAGAGAAA